MNTFKCTVDNRWMWGLESACITINSPRGGYVRVDKWHMDKLTDTQYELVLKCVRSENNSNVVELTTDEMKELAVIGKIAGTVYLPYSEYKKKQSTLAQRKFMSKNNPSYGSC